MDEKGTREISSKAGEIPSLPPSHESFSPSLISTLQMKDHGNTFDLNLKEEGIAIRLIINIYNNLSYSLSQNTIFTSFYFAML